MELWSLYEFTKITGSAIDLTIGSESSKGNVLLVLIYKYAVDPL